GRAPPHPACPVIPAASPSRLSVSCANGSQAAAGSGLGCLSLSGKALGGCARWSAIGCEAFRRGAVFIVRAAPALPGTTRVRLPSAPPPCCDRTAAKVSPLLESQRLAGARMTEDTRERR